MMAKDNTAMWVVAGLFGMGALYLYSKKRAEQEKVDSNVECGMELIAESGLKDVSAKIKEYEGNADCLRLLGEYVEKYHPALYQQLVMAGDLNNDQAQAALEVDKQEVAMALNMLETPAVGHFLMT